MAGYVIERTELRALAVGAGLAVAGVTSAEPFPDLADLLEERRIQGHLDGMNWFNRERADVSANPRALHERALSIISVGIPYYRSDLAPPNDGITRGRIARYAWGRDYHLTLKQRMSALADALCQSIGRQVEVRTLADTARIVDRAVAARSGVGWYGKHTNIIVPGHGSFVMLGELLVDVELEPDNALTKTCGKCRICLDKCPTGAIISPYVVSGPLCISFQTIEQRGAVPRELRSRMGNWVFGCDHCQDVCPYTGAAKDMFDQVFEPASHANAWPSLAWLLTMSAAEFADTYRGTAVKRTRRVGLARNAAIALGNVGTDSDRTTLTEALHRHDEPLVRAHAAWALGRRYGHEVKHELERGRTDMNADVGDECRIALEALA